MSLNQTIFFFIPFSTTSDVLALISVSRDFKDVTRNAIESYTASEYHNPKVLVLDEATSSLDGITENAIMDAIQNLSHKKTIIIIAHRLSTLMECDIIHMLDKGKIIDSGTYSQLIKNNKEFRTMSKQL